MDTQIRVLLIGDDTYEMYVKAFYECFIRLGYQNVKLFATNDFQRVDGSKIKKLLIRIENKLSFGIGITKLNLRLQKCIQEFQPDLVFVYSSRLINKKSIRTMKKNRCKLFVYNNDDPFANYYPWYFWRRFKKMLKYTDIGFVYREKNIQDFMNAGCNEVHLLKAYYVQEKNYYIKNPNIMVPDVLFLGHNEDDGRGEYIRALLKRGIEVGVTSRTWEEFECQNSLLVKLEDSHTKYNEMLNACKIAIVFLSKINNDTYTRRCFEIPATKTMMIAPYTNELASMFEENQEIIFYKEMNEFVDKIEYYLRHEKERNEIAEAGYLRLLKDGHEVKDRVCYVMDIYNAKYGN